MENLKLFPLVLFNNNCYITVTNQCQKTTQDKGVFECMVSQGLESIAGVRVSGTILCEMAETSGKGCHW